jgi:hypothetical protein
MSHDKTGTSDATAADISKCVILCWQSRKIAYNVHTFLKKFSSVDENAKTDFSKAWELTVQPCAKGSIADL